VVYAIRDERLGERRLKKLATSVFYRVFRQVSEIDAPLDVGDFRLIDRRALDAMRLLRENNRYVRGMFGWIGFRQTGVHYRRDPRAAGTTKYPPLKLFGLAVNAIVSFSNAPLRLALKLGFAVSAMSLLFGLAALVAKAVGLYSVSGLASLVVLTAFIGGIQLIVLGVIGEYIAHIWDEVKHRPLYLVQEVQNFERAPASAGAPPEPMLHTRWR
jgi:polyisoprenyl-phosphate glycosyltransferase